MMCGGPTATTRRFDARILLPCFSFAYAVFPADVIGPYDGSAKMHTRPN